MAAECAHGWEGGVVHLGSARSVAAGPPRGVGWVGRGRTVARLRYGGGAGAWGVWRWTMGPGRAQPSGRRTRWCGWQARGTRGARRAGGGGGGAWCQAMGRRRCGGGGAPGMGWGELRGFAAQGRGRGLRRAALDYGAGPGTAIWAVHEVRRSPGGEGGALLPGCESCMGPGRVGLQSAELWGWDRARPSGRRTRCVCVCVGGGEAGRRRRSGGAD